MKFVRLALIGTVVVVSSWHASFGYADSEAFGGWAGVSSTGPVGGGSSSWRYWFDAQYRKPDFDGRADQILLRPAAGYALNRDWTVWLGYAYLRTDTQAGRSIDEHRPWQQLSWNIKRMQNSTISARFRLEQRDIESGSDLGWRLRAQLKYVHELDSTNKAWIYAFIEPFINLNDTDWGAKSGLGQNRFGVGYGLQLSSRMNVEFGYMNQFLNRTRAENAYNHLAIINLKARI